jgi:hypothetical protein
MNNRSPIWGVGGFALHDGGLPLAGIVQQPPQHRRLFGAIQEGGSISTLFRRRPP